MITGKTFLQAVQGPDEAIDVVHCALLVAAQLQPGLDVSQSVKALDELVANARGEIASGHELLEYLYEACTRPQFCCRFRWQAGSMAIWDNRATHHCALNDYHGEFRLMHRITIEGEPLDAAA